VYNGDFFSSVGGESRGSSPRPSERSYLGACVGAVVKVVGGAVVEDATCPYHAPNWLASSGVACHVPNSSLSATRNDTIYYAIFNSFLARKFICLFMHMDGKNFISNRAWDNLKDKQLQLLVS
jgi:hypothetical protein